MPSDSRREQRREALRERKEANWVEMTDDPALNISWAVKRWSGDSDRWPMAEYEAMLHDSGALRIFDLQLHLYVRIYPPSDFSGLSVQAWINGGWETVRPGSALA